MADDEGWATDSTKATTISIWQQGATESAAVSEFKPTFTYSIFGDEESIFGYRNLQIDVDFAAHDLSSNVSWTQDDKFKSVGTTKALDLRDTLADFVPEGSFRSKQAFKDRLQAEDSSQFKPPGDKVRSWTREGRQYEIWAGSLMDPAVKDLLNRAQILVSFFIEGGTHLETEDQEWTIARWRVFFVYEKLPKPPAPKASMYSIVGYATTYRFLTFVKSQKHAGEASKEHQFPTTEALDVLKLPYRGRISQFLIMPPHSHQGHGSMLYATIFQTFLEDPSCVEITVEDPNEAFDDMRDYCDFTRLLQNGTLEKIRLDHNLDPKLTLRGKKLPLDKMVNKQLLTSIRKENKLVSRQFLRLVELWLLSRIPSTSRQAGTARLTRKAKATDEGDRAMYYWRLLVKSRIFKQNRDKLVDMEQSEVVNHLEETVNSLLDDYERLLAKLADKAIQGAANDVSEASGHEAGPTKRGKRNLVVEDDEDDEEDSGAVGGRAKRQKSAVPAE